MVLPSSSVVLGLRRRDFARFCVDCVLAFSEIVSDHSQIILVVIFQLLATAVLFTIALSGWFGMSSIVVSWCLLF